MAHGAYRDSKSFADLYYNCTMEGGNRSRTFPFKFSNFPRKSLLLIYVSATGRPILANRKCEPDWSDIEGYLRLNAPEMLGVSTLGRACLQSPD
jgi:hypothetical protein